MSRESQFRIRMSINKFNNRPPFNLKKADGSTSTELGKNTVAMHRDYYDGQYLNSRQYLNCPAKVCGKVGKYLEKMDESYKKTMKNKNENIIPKIIESFQKVTPKKRSKAIKNRQKSDSLHTLYRKNVSNFGKNIPNHKLMKKLLINLNDGETEINLSGSYENIDVIPSRDTDERLINQLTEVNLLGRIDKMTSTTGLQWPIDSDFGDDSEVDLKPSRTTISKRYRTRIPQKKNSVDKIDCGMRASKFAHRDNLRTFVGSKRSLCSYDLEYFPTKEIPNLQPRKPDYVSKIPTKQEVHLVSGLNKLNLNKEFPKYKFNADHAHFKNDHSYMNEQDRHKSSDERIERKKKERSFVQTQVERYNKINTKKNANRKSYLPVNTNVKNFQEIKKKINKNYMNIMSTMRENLPQLGEEMTGESRDGSQQWSDNTTDAETEVKFPKETRNAMEHMMKNITRIPLAKCIKNQNLQLHPAISINSQFRAEYEECTNTPSGISYQKTNSVPYSKYSTCDRGIHGRTFCRQEKGHAPPRYNNHRIRPNYNA